MQYQTHLFQNGLRLIYHPEKSAVVYCGLVINAGSRDEKPNEFGMAHFVEHMLFKGTEKRRSTQIISRLENLGGELNAFTSKEETVVYAAILKEHTEKAVELIADIVLHSTFPEKEIEKELDIVLDEIELYNDSPSELIFDDFDEILFKNHALAHHILGAPHLLKEYDSKRIQEFVKRLYRPDEMVFFVSGDLEFKKIVRWIEKYFQHGEKKENDYKRFAPSIYKPKTRMIERKTHQVHVLIGGRAYDLYDKNRIAMCLLNNILGGEGMSSLLNLSLREKNALVYQVESNYQPFSDTGEWSVYFGCDADSVKKCENLVFKELNKLRRKKLSESFLRKSKLQLMGQMAIAAEHRENMAIGLGKNFARFNEVDNMQTVKEKVEAVSASQLLEIANNIFIPEKTSILRYV